MDVARFQNSPLGRIVRISGYDARFNEEYDHFAYVADPLPDDIALANETWGVVADAMLSLGRLDDATSRFPNPGLLVRPTLRREAMSTAALEGTFADLEEVLAADADETEALGPEMREVINVVTAIEAGVSALRQGRSIGVQLACELQEILIRGTRSEGADTGRIRTGNVFIGREDQRVPDSRFIPCPAGPLLEEGFRQWETWVNVDISIHLLVKTALAHYQFETLHPFHDGNGRLGRILAILQLMADGALHNPNLAISAWLEERDAEYRDGLARVSETGDFDAWVRFFARGVLEQAERERTRVDELLNLRHVLVERVRGERFRGLAVRVTEDLIGFPIMRVPELAQRYGVSFEAANSAVGRLVDIGVLRQVGNRAYGRVFVAEEVLRVLRY